MLKLCTVWTEKAFPFHKIINKQTWQIFLLHSIGASLPLSRSDLHHLFQGILIQPWSIWTDFCSNSIAHVTLIHFVLAGGRWSSFKLDHGDFCVVVPTQGRLWMAKSRLASSGFFCLFLFPYKLTSLCKHPRACNVPIPLFIESNSLELPVKNILVRDQERPEAQAHLWTL